MEHKKRLAFLLMGTVLLSTFFAGALSEKGLATEKDEPEKTFTTAAISHLLEFSVLNPQNKRVSRFPFHLPNRKQLC